MISNPIPDPLPISCTDCHQSMRIEFQSSMHCLHVVVAAECACGRFIGTIDYFKIRTMIAGMAPLTRHSIDACDRDVGKEAADLIVLARKDIVEAERVIAAATWANQGRAKS